MKTNKFIKASILSAAITLSAQSAFSQDLMPYDNGLSTYHTSPRYRESESHPLRIVGYLFHPIGWVLREAIFRPISYLASSTETSRSVTGFREPYDYRRPDCFSSDDAAPDCRTTMPFNYSTMNVVGSELAPAATETGTETDATSAEAASDRQVYFPDVNFDFNKQALNDLGKGRAFQIAELLKAQAGLKVVLQGHADLKGSDDYNQKLGLDRAEAVRSELVSLGVPAERISTVSFGKTQPALAQEADWARAVNRRVEVHTGE